MLEEAIATTITVCENSKDFSGDANMWYEHNPYKVEIVGSTPTSTTNYFRGYFGFDCYRET